MTLFSFKGLFIYVILINCNFYILVEDKKRTSEENLGNLANPKARKPGFGSDHRDLSHLAESAGARRFQNKKLVAKKRLNLIRNGFENNNSF